jgi:hypothetical protein
MHRGNVHDYRDAWTKDKAIYHVGKRMVGGIFYDYKGGLPDLIALAARARLPPIEEQSGTLVLSVHGYTSGMREGASEEHQLPTKATRRGRRYQRETRHSRMKTAGRAVDGISIRRPSRREVTNRTQ